MGMDKLHGRCVLDPLRPGVLSGREDEAQSLQGVDSLMTELLPMKHLD